MKTTLVLDYSKWRCGGDTDSKNEMGEGFTYLLNKEGFMCCLGQFSKQLNSEITDEIMFQIATPARLEKDIELLNEKGSPLGLKYSNTLLSIRAVEINDNTKTTPEEKIVLLKELFEKKGYSIEVINKP